MRTLIAHSLRAALAVLLMLSLFTGFALPAQAQQSIHEPSRLYVGLRAGITSTDFYGDAVELADPEIGFDGGVFLTYRFHPHFAIQPEVLFATQKARTVQSDVFQSVGTIDYELGFLDVPVLFKVYLPEQTGTQLHLFAGPYMGFLLYDKATDVENTSGEAATPDPKLRTTHFGIDVGLGVDAYAGRHEVTLDTRYDLGLTNLFEDTDLPSFRNRGFMVSLGLRF